VTHYSVIKDFLKNRVFICKIFDQFAIFETKKAFNSHLIDPYIRGGVGKGVVVHVYYFVKSMFGRVGACVIHTVVRH